MLIQLLKVASGLAHASRGSAEVAGVLDDPETQSAALYQTRLGGARNTPTGGHTSNSSPHQRQSNNHGAGDLTMELDQARVGEGKAGATADDHVIEDGDIKQSEGVSKALRDTAVRS